MSFKIVLQVAMLLALLVASPTENGFASAMQSSNGIPGTQNERHLQDEPIATPITAQPTEKPSTDVPTIPPTESTTKSPTTTPTDRAPTVLTDVPTKTPTVPTDMPTKTPTMNEKTNEQTSEATDGFAFQFRLVAVTAAIAGTFIFLL